MMTSTVVRPGETLPGRQPGPAGSPPLPQARIEGIGTATTGASYTQTEVLDYFGIADPRVRSVFENSAIDRRYLSLPPRDAGGTCFVEPQGELLLKHRRLALDMGSRALLECLSACGADPSDVGFLACVTTTGFLTPGLSALLVRQLGLDPGCHRVDVVGMGCNAGLNGLNAVA